MGLDAHVRLPPRTPIQLILLLGLFLFIAVVPHRFITSPGGIPIEWVAMVPSALIAGMLILVLRDREDRLRVGSIPILLPGLTLCAGLILGSLGSESPLTGLPRILYYTMTGIVVSVCVYAVVREFKDARLIVSWMVWVGAAVGCYGILEFFGFVDVYGSVFNQRNPRYTMLTTEDFGSRILGPVGHPVYLGMFLVGLLPLSTYHLLHTRGRWALASWVPCVLITTGLFLTFTRGAYVAAVVSLYVYLRSQVRRRSLVAVGVLLIVIVGALSVGQVRIGLTGRGTIGQLRSFRTDQRGLAYAHVAALLQDSPLIGVGVGNYRFLANRYGDFDDTPDNLYLLVLAETGVAGAVGISFLVVVVLGSVRCAARQGGAETSFLGHAILGSIVAFLVNMITCDALMFPLTRTQFWLIAGVGLSLGRASVPNTTAYSTQSGR